MTNWSGVSSVSGVLSAGRRGTPVLLSVSVSDNSGNSPQMAAPRRSCEIDQSMQRFHVGCDNRFLLGNEYGGLHGHEFLDRTLMILILTNQAVFVTLSVVKITSIGAAILILTQNHADVIKGPIRCCDTQCLVSLCAPCCHLWRDININTNQAESWGRFPVPRICRWESISGVASLNLFL